jgi:hypothetical protein
MNRLLPIGVLTAVAAVVLLWRTGPAPESTVDVVAEPVAIAAPDRPALTTPASTPASSASSVAVASGAPPSAHVVLATVRAPGAQLSDRTIWDARRRLAAEPALAEDLADTALHVGTTDNGRALALDLLAHDGGPRAQAALVRVLKNPTLASRAGAQTGLLVQRAGFVTEPTPALVAQLSTMTTAADPEIRRAALATTGGLARRLAASGQGPEAEALLTATLRKAPLADPADEAARVLGLGNAAQPADEGTLLAAAIDARIPVRHAAVRGLRRYQGGAVLAQLGQAAGDPNAAIQRAALRGLSGRVHLPAAVLTQLGDTVRGQRLRRANDALLVTVLSPHAARAEARASLEALLQRATDDAGLRARIRSILRAG